MHTTRFLFYAGLLHLGHAAYSVKDNYDASNWLDMFDFETRDDPTNGYVNYIDRDMAQSTGLFKIDNGVVTFGSDSTLIASGRGRNSVRLASKNRYTHGLVVIDVAHMPGNACGIWPAFWMTGDHWPDNGEIDIIEGVNLQLENQATLHTNGDCSFDGASCFRNNGCPKLSAGGPNSFGNGLNAINGGTYAVEWNSDHISLWFFRRGSEPGDVLGDGPDPSRWGAPTTIFAGGNGCDIDSHFRAQQIVFDTTFCGDWAGAVFNQDPTCAATGVTCPDYVQNNPGAFSEAYWTVNALKVYSDDGSGPRVLTSRDNTPASTAALSVFTPVTETDINPPVSLPTAFFSSNSSETISLLTGLPTVIDNTILTTLTSTAEPTEVESVPGFSGNFGSPSTMTLFVTDDVVAQTIPTSVPYDYYNNNNNNNAPPGEYGDYYYPQNGYGRHYGSGSDESGSGSGGEQARKMKRAHRAARHLENHKLGA